MEDGDIWATVIRELRTEGHRVIGENRIRWHKSPFFIFRRSTTDGNDGVRERLKEDFAFIIRGKYLKGNVAKQAYFQENRQELNTNNRPAYFPNIPSGMYDIEDDDITPSSLSHPTKPLQRMKICQYPDYLHSIRLLSTTIACYRKGMLKSFRYLTNFRQRISKQSI